MIRVFIQLIDITELSLLFYKQKLLPCDAIMYNHCHVMVNRKL